jgi:hypothetical protein
VRQPSCLREFRAARRGLVALALIAGLGACKKKTPDASEPSAPQDKQAAPSADFSGRVKGLVKLREGAALPTLSLPEDVLRQTAATVPEGCPALSAADEQRVEQNPSTGGLSPVHIAITQMSAAPPREKRTQQVFIDDCRLKPGLVAAMHGDVLRVTNRAHTAFLPVLPGDSFMQAIMPGKSREVELNGLGAFDVQCSFGGYCGSTMLVVVAHSLYAVTDSEGRFEITGIPLDEELTLHAWNPLFDVTTASIKLTKAEPEKELELVLTPQVAATGTKPPEEQPTDSKAGAKPAERKAAGTKPAERKAE